MSHSLSSDISKRLKYLTFPLFMLMLSCNQNKYQSESPESSLPRQNTLAKTDESIHTLNTDSLINEVAINFEKGNYMESLMLASEGYEYAVKNGNQRLMAILLNNIGLVHWRLNDLDAAMEAYNQSAIIAEKIKFNLLLALVHTNRALILKNQGKFDEAFVYNEKSISLLKKENKKRELAISYNNHGQIFKEQKSLDSAKFYYTKALELYEEENFINGMSATYYNLSEIYTNNNKQKALEAARVSLDLAIASESKIRTLEANEKLFEIYDFFNQPDSALKYYKTFSDLKISMLVNNQSEKILEYQTKFGHEVKNLRIQNLEKEKIITKGKIGLYSGFTLFIMVIILFFIYRNLSKVRLKKNQLELELKNSENMLLVKEKELKSYIIDISKKNTLINKLKIQTIETSIAESDRSSKIASLLNQKILTEDDWKTFKNKFSIIYPNFFVNIKQQKIDLTEADTRFLVLFRLKLSGKEMVDILGISLQSVRTSKMRLNRKLKSSNYKSVEDFNQKV